jgi:hypothetical protein
MNELRFIERQVPVLPGSNSIEPVTFVLQELSIVGEWVDVPVYTLEQQAEDQANSE